MAEALRPRVARPPWWFKFRLGRLLFRRLPQKWWHVEHRVLSPLYFRFLRGRVGVGGHKDWNAMFSRSRAWAGLSEMVWTRLCGHGWGYSAKLGGIYLGIYTFDNNLKGDRRPGWHWPRRTARAKGATDGD